MRWNPDLCKRGHYLTTSNTYQRPGGPRECRECRKERHRHQWLTRDTRPRKVVKPRAERKVERVVVAWPEYEEMPIGSAL